MSSCVYGTFPKLFWKFRTACLRGKCRAGESRRAGIDSQGLTGRFVETFIRTNQYRFRVNILHHYLRRRPTRRLTAGGIHCHMHRS